MAFDAKTYHREYLRKWRQGIRSPKIAKIKICEYCHKEFTNKISRGKRFCSIACCRKVLPAWNKGKKLHYVVINKGKKADYRGEKHWNWKGGITSHDYIERRRFKKYTQKKVFERDDYTCKICGKRGVDLQVDHIKPWSKYIELRFDIDNCRTLCAKCHYLITFGKSMPPTVRAWGHNLKGGNIL